MNKPVNPGQDGIAALLQGARSFREREYREPESLMPGLSAGQQPKAMMIACADSRVDPALIFGARPGDLLVVRVVANLVPPPDSDGMDSGVMSAVENPENAGNPAYRTVLGARRLNPYDDALGAVSRPEAYCSDSTVVGRHSIRFQSENVQT